LKEPGLNLWTALILGKRASSTEVFPIETSHVEFWQEQGDEAIFSAAWEMVELAEEERNGRKSTFQRTVTVLARI